MWAAVRLGALAVSEGARVEAVDFSPAMIELARSFDPEGLASYRVCTLCEMGAFPDATFDLVIFHCCLQDGSGFIISVVQRSVRPLSATSRTHRTRPSASVAHHVPPAATRRSPRPAFLSEGSPSRFHGMTWNWCHRARTPYG